MVLGSPHDGPVTVLWVAYDGTEYSGFQVQPNAPTVQACLEKALETLSGGKRIRVNPAGRTDAGVHAVGQVVSFAWASSIPTEQLPAALNGLLPRDIVVFGSALAAPGFHARKRAVGKRYVYAVLLQEVPSPFWSRWALHWRGSLDLEAMREAAGHWAGTHDFSSFQVSGRPVVSPVRTVSRIEIYERHSAVLISVEADGFLYKMVRSMVGTLLEIGRGALPADSAGDILAGQSRDGAGPTAPAHGLFLWAVSYKEQDLKLPEAPAFQPFLTPLGVS